MLKGRTGLIEGGGTGIDRAAARRFSKEGADLGELGIDEPSIFETEILIGKACRYDVCDVRDGECISAMIDPLDRLDKLVSNTAVSSTLLFRIEILINGASSRMSISGLCFNLPSSSG